VQSGDVPAVSEGDLGGVRRACRASFGRRAGRAALHVFVMGASLVGRRLR